VWKCVEVHWATTFPKPGVAGPIPAEGTNRVVFRVMLDRVASPDRWTRGHLIFDT
jgi:hypothetical protein